ncbi:Phloem protein 2-like protein [Dioscorea alata]|uniref:Phloem protein 2-like protein n=1 Tax=Dioscorea alata TaxID=55571 RepID=A0ACB7VWT1_DIOAL|nr:Phloem protein 2-like protein [Dioscorea alata]
MSQQEELTLENLGSHVQPHEYTWDSFGESIISFPAKGLKIAWGDDQTYWKEVQIPKEDRKWLKYEDGMELLQVCLFEAKGILDLEKTQGLSPNKTYELYYVIKFKDEAFGWQDLPVSFKIAPPGGQNKKIKISDNFGAYEKNKWHKVFGCEFTVGSNLHGKYKFGMYGIEALYWKGGIILHGVLIQPKD